MEMAVLANSINSGQQTSVSPAVTTAPGWADSTVERPQLPESLPTLMRSSQSPDCLFTAGQAGL